MDYLSRLVPAEAEIDDIGIVKNVQAGDTESFSFLVSKYHRHLLNFIYRLVGDREIVEDIGQEVFLNVYKSIRNFDVQRGVPFSAWLFITARNRCIGELRKKSLTVVSMEKTGDLSARSKTPEEAASEEERVLAIDAALEQLPDPYKSTILQSLRGDSLEQIAVTSRISIGTVKSRLFRAREKMRLLLHDYLGGDDYGRL
jgi:RNA polymerase sigma-70 factor (ECF subfamily)